MSGSLIFSCATVLLATLSLVFRFILPLSDKARAVYATLSLLAFAIYFVFNHDWLWAAIWVVLIYRDFRHSLPSRDPNLLIANAVLLYGLGAVWLLDSMGLSSLYMRPSVLLVAVLLVVVSLITWAFSDTKKTKTTST